MGILLAKTTEEGFVFSHQQQQKYCFRSEKHLMISINNVFGDDLSVLHQSQKWDKSFCQSLLRIRSFFNDFADMVLKIQKCFQL
jgi:hypothetical protein